MAIDPLPFDFGRDKRFCVYLYRDPRPRKKNAPIWVGKGLTRSRPDKHWKYGSHNPFLNNILRQIRSAGLVPTVEFVGFFDKEEDAFSCERALIKQFGRRQTVGCGTLCNLTDGGEGSVGAHGPQRSPKKKVLTNAAHERFAAAFRDARICAGLTQADVSKRLGPYGISQGYISLVEAGTKGITIGTCEALAAAVGMRLEIKLIPYTPDT